MHTTKLSLECSYHLSSLKSTLHFFFIRWLKIPVYYIFFTQIPLGQNNTHTQRDTWKKTWATFIGNPWVLTFFSRLSKWKSSPDFQNLEQNASDDFGVLHRFCAPLAAELNTHTEHCLYAAKVTDFFRAMRTSWKWGRRSSSITRVQTRTFLIHTTMITASASSSFKASTVLTKFCLLILNGICTSPAPLAHPAYVGGGCTLLGAIAPRWPWNTGCPLGDLEMKQLWAIFENPEPFSNGQVTAELIIIFSVLLKFV